LVSACAEWLTAEGIEVVFVSVGEGADGFYLRHGFRPCIGPWFFRDLTKAAAAPD
jgi:hypothetical protein